MTILQQERGGRKWGFSGSLLTCQETLLTTPIQPPISKISATKRIFINHNTLQGTWATQLQNTELLLSAHKDPGQGWPKQPANWIFTPIAPFMPCEVQARNYKTKKKRLKVQGLSGLMVNLTIHHQPRLQEMFHQRTNSYQCLKVLRGIRNTPYWVRSWPIHQFAIRLPGLSQQLLLKPSWA